ncbi:hypothetical protein M9Y10_041368 [Tritrichomonas musculus]|uniref:Uncharacterized protein n=1 Tax=Tritrichomonas musculus TaxID=1915356 RepID=A0ABR2K459_9EUKA
MSNEIPNFMTSMCETEIKYTQNANTTNSYKTECKIILGTSGNTLSNYNSDITIYIFVDQDQEGESSYFEFSVFDREIEFIDQDSQLTLTKYFAMRNITQTIIIDEDSLDESIKRELKGIAEEKAIRNSSL